MSKNMNVPKLRFKEFKEDWNEDKIGKVFKVSAGGDIKTENVNQLRTDDFPYPIYANAEKAKGLYGYSNLYKSDANVVTVAGRGVNIGIAHARLEPFYPIVRLLVLKPLKDFDVKFWEHQLNQLNLFLESTGVPQLTAPQMSSYTVKYPSKQEQKKIASFLNSVDTKIEQLTRKEELLQQYKKGVMQKIFNQEIRFKADDGSEFCDWEEKKLSTKCTIQKGSQLNKDILTEEGNYPALNGGINPSGFTRDWNTEANTITISEGGNSCGYVNFVTTRFWSGGHNYSLQDLEQSIDAQYLYQYLKFNEEAIMRLRVGSGLPNIQKREISNFKISVPYLKEQIKIANFLLSIDFKIGQVKKQLEYIKKFKKALLQQMFV